MLVTRNISAKQIQKNFYYPYFSVKMEVHFLVHWALITYRHHVKKRVKNIKGSSFAYFSQKATPVTIDNGRKTQDILLNKQYMFISRGILDYTK